MRLRLFIRYLIVLSRGLPGCRISMVLTPSDYYDLTFLMRVILYLIQVPVGDCTAHAIGKITILLLFDGDLSQSVPASEILIVSCFDYIIVIHLNSPPVSRMETSLLNELLLSCSAKQTYVSS